MAYIELTIDLNPVQPFSDILTVQLAEVGFDSFVDTETGIIAYGDQTKTSTERAIQETLLGEERDDLTVNYSFKILKDQNWNAVWESNFEPIFIENKLSILAPFHDKLLAKGLVVEIQPQMSFGTGHHPTTYMMAQALLEMDTIPEVVLDMGTGTGVLAILSEKLFPNCQITAVDIEKDAVENALENCQRNSCQHITVLQGDQPPVVNKKIDIILANINKNTLTTHIPHYVELLQQQGKLIISGFFESDVAELLILSEKYALKQQKIYTKDTWACIQLTGNA